ncbi:hypothetical protein LMG19144_02280 [Xanthomonas arboricola pv. fragariae]|nr:hypothetical protein LMG19144_02280 [Xanthomonas arboricola pv. fragariae]
MICVCARALRSMMTSPLPRLAGSNTSDCINRDQPRMALSGVRNSWLSVARNSSLTRLACSA